MKYSFMTFSCPELSLQDVLALAEKTGYDGVEPRIMAKHAHGIEIEMDAEARKRVAEAVKRSAVELGCVATSCKYADPETREENVELTHKSIDLAADIGCSRLRVFGGKLGDGLDRDAATELVAGSLSEVAAHAAERGVVVCMETHDDWCDPAHVAAVMKRVDAPFIAVNWDLMHPVRMELATMQDAFETLRPWIRHVHVHDAFSGSDLAPIGEGYIDHKAAIELLESMSYRGYLSGEWINWSDPYEKHLPRELATLRSYESNRS